VVGFTRAYHPALEAQFEAHGRSSFQFHGERADIIVIIQASDGFATFYLPPSPSGSVNPGYYLYDHRSYDLNTICQSLSVHRLKVSSPRICRPWNEFEPMPPDTELVPDFHGPWIHDDVRNAVAQGKLTSVPGMTISPVVHVRDGIRESVVPSRVVIWAPTFDFAGLGVRRLYLWTHADFWWLPEKLNLDATHAVEAAAADVLALRTVLAHVASFGVDQARQNTTVHAADLLESMCDELVALIAANGDDEEGLHQWLYQREHQVFLDPHLVEVKSKIPFGAQVSDFVVRRADGTYVLIEIEAATTAIFRQDNSEPTAPFNHACQQVRDWQRYIRDNVATVRNELGLTSIYEPDGKVIIGRTAAIAGKDAERRWLDMKSRAEPAVATYDDLCVDVRALAGSLRQLLR
jgi:hypothetical protein